MDSKFSRYSILGGRRGLHIISHGTEGTLYLGSTTLNQRALDSYSTLLGQIGDQMSDSGDILLYGCNVASGITGQQFIGALASITNADVAASTDTTGINGFGGNGVLELHAGSVEIASLELANLSTTLASVNSAPTFKVGDGIVITAISIDRNDEPSIVIQSDGKILLTGSVRQSGGDDISVVRYNTDGDLDITFNSSGISTTSINRNDHSYGIAVQSDGKIIVVGTSYFTDGDFAVVRYNPNGSLDNTFSSDGKLTTNFGYLTQDQAEAVAVQSDNKILVGGKSDTEFALVRYNTDGSLDTSFSSDGVVTTSLDSSSVNARIA